MTNKEKIDKPSPSLREHLNEIIFGAETPAGKTFDIILLWTIILSVLAVIMESVSAIRLEYGKLLIILEWFFTVLFTIEYVLRLIATKSAHKYAFSFFGIVDLLAIIPTYLSIFFVGTQSLIVIRGLRLLRVFRIFKLGRYAGEAQVLVKALYASRHKVIVFLSTIFLLVIIMGTAMYLIEGADNGFTSIPRGIYWAIVTMTTVGYGDISPQTPLGQSLAAILMIMGYAIIAVPTGIVTAELNQANIQLFNSITCRSCNKEGHDHGAIYCQFCGEELKNQ